MPMNCLFCDIIAGQLPSRKIYEDDKACVFEDVKPQAPTHVLIVPKRHIVDLKNARPKTPKLSATCLVGSDRARARHRRRLSHRL